MVKKFWGRGESKVPDDNLAEGLTLASQTELEEASAAARALHALIVEDKAQLPGFEVSGDGQSAELGKMTRVSALRDVLFSLSIKQSESGTWWLAQQQMSHGTEVDPGTVRDSTEFPLSPGYEVVVRTEYSADPHAPFKSFTPDRSLTTEVEAGPLTSNVCQGMTRQLRDIAATAVLPAIAV